MRWLVTGAGGMLASDLVDVLAAHGHDVHAAPAAELDIVTGDLTCVIGYDVVANAAAWTAVDAAEQQEAAAFAVNAVGPARLAAACADAGVRLVHVSTDYVFDGEGGTPYAEDDLLRPRSAYGRTKAAGEWAVRAAAPDHLILRTAWLYGARGGCFPRTIARVVAERGGADVIDDQVGQPTWTVDVAELAERLVAGRAPAGTYHATAAGRASWFEFAQAVVAADGGDPAAVRATTSADFVRSAPRPAWSVLGHQALRRAGVPPIGDWRERWQVAAPSVLSGAHGA